MGKMVWCCGILVLLVGGAIEAGVFTEATYDSHADLTVVYNGAAAPGSAGGTLVGSAAVTSQKLVVPLYGLHGVEYGIAGATWGGAEYYFDWASSSDWGSNTIIGMVRIGMTGQSFDNRAHTLLCTAGASGGDPAQDGVWFLADSDAVTGMRALELVLSSGGAQASVGYDFWDPIRGTDYFMAASWEDAGGGSVSLRVYARQVNDNVGTTTRYASGSAAYPGAPMSLTNQLMYVGMNPADENDSLGGEVGRIMILDEFTDTQGNFDALFNAYAEVIADWDQATLVDITYENGADMDVVYNDSAPPADPVGTLTMDATVSNGVLNVTDTNTYVYSGDPNDWDGSGCQYGTVGPTWRGAEKYFNIVNDSDWGENTVLAIVRRNDWDGGRHAVLTTADAESHYTAYQGVFLHSDGQNLALHLNNGWYTPSMQAYNWDLDLEPGVDYFVAGSWRHRKLDNELDMTTYIRKVSDVVGDYLGFRSVMNSGLDPNVLPHDYDNHYLYVGRRGPGNDTFDGQIGRVLIRGEYTGDAAGFDALFQQYAEGLGAETDHLVRFDATYEAGVNLDNDYEPNAPPAAKEGLLLTAGTTISGGALHVGPAADFSGARYPASASGIGNLYRGSQYYYNLGKNGRGGAETFGENTIVGIIRRNDMDADRHTILQTNDGRDGLWLLIWEDGVLQLQIKDEWNGVENAKMYGSPRIEPGVDTLVAASFRDNWPADPSLEVRLYFRPVADTTGVKAKYATCTYDYSSNPRLKPTGWQNFYTLVGGRNDSPGDRLDGQIGRLTILGEFADSQQDFDTLFNTYAEDIAPDRDHTVRFDARYISSVNLDNEYEPGAAPASASGSLQGGATVSGGALHVTSTSGSGARYGITGRPWWGSEYYFNMTNDGGWWGENTMVAIVRRENDDSNAHAVLCAGETADNENGIIWHQLSNGNMQLALSHNWTLASGYLWKPLELNNDYLVACSWKDNGDTIDMRMYSRKLKDSTGYSVGYYQTNGVEDPGGPSGAELWLTHIGHRLDGTSPFDGKISRVLVLGQYADSQAQFDALFDTYKETTSDPPDPMDCAEVWVNGDGLTGDINRDCYVNLEDFGVMAEYWLETDCAAHNGCGNADINASNDVTIVDLRALAEDWLRCNDPGHGPPCEATW